MRMKQKKYFTPNALAKDLENLVADKDKLSTKPEISDWLTRLYVIAGKLTIAQKACREHRFTGSAAETVRQFLDEFPSTMVWLHQLAEEKIVMLEEK